MKISQITVLLIASLFSQAAFAQQRASSIHSIDFANFKYPGSGGLFPTAEYATESFILRNGKSKEIQNQYGMTLVGISYGDVTGDGVDEAMISLIVETDGSAGVHHVYIYTLGGGKPKILWGFESGDRAWGGLKKVYAEGGNLVVELYRRGTQVEGHVGSTEPVGLCCPCSFTRTQYQWQNGRFQQRGEIEIFPVTDRRYVPPCAPQSNNAMQPTAKQRCSRARDLNDFGVVCAAADGRRYEAMMLKQEA